MHLTLENTLSERTFLTFGGVETHLAFSLSHRLRHFAAFEVFEAPEVWTRLQETFFEPIAHGALAHGHGVVTNALTWRAAPRYLAKLGYAPTDVKRMNAAAVAHTRRFVEGLPPLARGRVILNAEIGPRDDGYTPGTCTPDEAQAYHAPQLAALTEAGVDVISALTLTTLPEALGIARSAKRIGVPLLLSPTVEANGKLPDGSSLEALITTLDREAPPIAYMVNCAHPSHLSATFTRAQGAAWLKRMRGLRVNASPKSHAELDNSGAAESEPPEALAQATVALARLAGVRIFGGCCGTDARHLAALARQTSSLAVQGDLALPRDFTLRPYHSDDAPSLVDVFYDAVAAIDNAIYDQRAREAWAPFPRDILLWRDRLDRVATWVVCRDTVPVGFASLAVTGEVEYLYVAPYAQRRGVARALLIQVVNAARHLGHRHLHTHASHVARSTFKRSGFQTVRANAVVRHGVELTNWRMTLDL